MKSRQTVVIALLAGLVAVLMWLGPRLDHPKLSPRGAPPSYWQEFSSYCAAKHQENDQWHHDFLCEFKVTDLVIAAFSVALVAATLLLAIVTLGLMIGGKRQIRLARDEFISSNRPRIRLKHIWLATPDGQGFFGKLQTDYPINTAR
jgi:hypothetical protein